MQMILGNIYVSLKKKPVASRQPVLERYRHPLANRLLCFQILLSLDICLTSVRSWFLTPGQAADGIYVYLCSCIHLHYFYRAFVPIWGMMN